MENINLNGPYPSYLSLMPYGILQNPVDYIPPLAAFPPVSLSERVQSVAGLPPAGVGVNLVQDPPPPNYVILNNERTNVPVTSQNYFHLHNTPDFQQAEWQQHQLWLEAVQYYTQRRHLYQDIFAGVGGGGGGFAPHHPSAFQPLPAHNSNPAPLPVVEIRPAGGRGKEEGTTTTTSTTKTDEGEASSKGKATCLICQETFKDETSLQKHFSLHVGDMSEKMYSCSQCPRKFSRSHNLRAHMQKHSNSKPGDKNKKAFQCAYCNKQFEKEKTLHRHMRSHHEAHCQQEQQEDSSSNSSKTVSMNLRKRDRQPSQAIPGIVELKPETMKESGELENKAETDERNNESVDTVVIPPMEEVSAIQPTQSGNLIQDDAPSRARRARKCSHPQRVVRVRGLPSYFEHEIPSFPSEIDKNGKVQILEIKLND